MKSDAIIIGAGPAGMMAAIRAAQRDRKVLLIERTSILGSKLLISGKGRCNLTNSCDVEDFLEKFSESRNFLRNAFARFFNTDLVSFFEDNHVKLKTERGGRVFPESDKSSDILDVLLSKLRNKNIKVVLGARVRGIILEKGKIQGVILYSGKRFLADHVAITTGGASYPETGSTGDGYKMAKKLGHEIIPVKPGLCPVIIKQGFIKNWQGISLKNVSLALFAGAKKIDERFGELIFTHFGLSGPVVLDMSAAIYDTLQAKKGVTLSINFKPALDHKKLDARLLREFKANPRKNVKNIFKNLLVQFNLLLSHISAYKAMKEYTHKPVGIVKNIIWFDTNSKSNILDRLVCKVAHFFVSDFFLFPLKRYLDVIGINYYFTFILSGLKINNTDDRVSDLGWWLHSDGLEKNLLSLKKYNLPIYVTENGLADAEDKYRADFIKEHLITCYNAIESGVNLKGYFHWSLLDNFEWYEGFWPRFGLVEIQRENYLTRKPRPSFYYYSDICKNNRVLVD